MGCTLCRAGSRMTPGALELWELGLAGDAGAGPARQDLSPGTVGQVLQAIVLQEVKLALPQWVNCLL